MKNADLNPKYGATCGRVAGRIANAQFKIDNSLFELEKNNGNACLHGGSEGWDRQIWGAKIIEKTRIQDCGLEKEQFCGVEFSLVSEHMDGGFPGKVEAKSTYLINDQD